MSWFTFRQNNTFGKFKEPAITVSIEADSAEEANRIAVDNGLYFDGVRDGRDCDCCGDRWYEAWGKDAGEDEPTDETDWTTMWAKGAGLPATKLIPK